jgi:hypothetical protein
MGPRRRIHLAAYRIAFLDRQRGESGDRSNARRFDHRPGRRDEENRVRGPNYSPADSRRKQQFVFSSDRKTCGRCRHGRSHRRPGAIRLLCHTSRSSAPGTEPAIARWCRPTTTARLMCATAVTARAAAPRSRSPIGTPRGGPHARSCIRAAMSEIRGAIPPDNRGSRPDLGRWSRIRANLMHIGVPTAISWSVGLRVPRSPSTA